MPGAGYPREVGERLRLEAYKKLASVQTAEQVGEIEAELRDRYGPPPEPVENLIEVARLRVVARGAGIEDVAVQGRHVRFGPVALRESQQLRLARLYPGSIVKDQSSTILVPAPRTARVGGQPLRDTAVLRWASELVTAVMGENVADAARVADTAAAAAGKDPR